LFSMNYKRGISPYSGFQDRLFQPLTHPSAGGISSLSSSEAAETPLRTKGLLLHSDFCILQLGPPHIMSQVS